MNNDKLEAEILIAFDDYWDGEANRWQCFKAGFEAGRKSSQVEINELKKALNMSIKLTSMLREELNKEDDL